MPKKVFQNEWVFDAFSEHPTFVTKRMFGGLAIYLHGRQMLILVEPTKSGRWDWNGILLCTGYEHHESLTTEFPSFSAHEAIKKWLFIESKAADFEEVMTKVSRYIETNDERIGIWPKVK